MRARADAMMVAGTDKLSSLLPVANGSTSCGESAYYGKCP